MDTQLKKGLLDICVLKCLIRQDSYGYKLIADISNYIEISESTLYPILKRLEEAKYLETYKEEHGGRLRKYYKITQLGRSKFQEFKKDASKILEVYDFIMEGDEE